MPHIILEYSANLQPEISHADLLKEFHQIMADVGKINIENCKSRVYVADQFLVGAGQRDAAFVHLDVRFLEGRSQRTISEVGTHLLSLLKSWTTNTSPNIDLQITVEIQDIEKARYFKFPKGTFTVI